MVILEWYTILISPSATSPSLTGLNGIWRPVGSDDVQGRILANLILQNIETGDLNLENEIHIVYENSSYGHNCYFHTQCVFRFQDSNHLFQYFAK